MLDFNDRPNSSYIGSPPTAEIAVDLPNKKNTCGIKQEQLNCINCSVVTCFSCISVFILVVCSHGARCHRANKHLLRARNSFDVARSLLVHGSGEKKPEISQNYNVYSKIATMSSENRSTKKKHYNNFQTFKSIFSTHTPSLLICERKFTRM